MERMQRIDDSRDTETESQIYNLLILIWEMRQDEEREDPTTDDVNLLSSAGIRVGK